MDNTIFKYIKCDAIFDTFGKDKVEKRFDTLCTELDEFLAENNLSAVAKVNKFLLAKVLVDYFSDIKRLKDFQAIKLANSQKIIAYTAYWLLRRKPIQINDPQSKEQQVSIMELDTLNERFVLQYIFNYFSKRKRKSHVFLRTESGLRNYAGTMLYYLIYRVRDAQSLEMIIASFFAGQIYEQIDEDLSSKLHAYDHDLPEDSR